MIVCGYPGIGKTTLSKGFEGKYLDLESSMFNIDNKKIPHWEIPYIRTAEYLSSKGFIVFVSSHKEVVAALQNCSEFAVMCYPSLDLRDAWITRLKKRYAESHLRKDKAAVRHVALSYTKDITQMAAEAEEYQIPTTVLKSMDYDLKAELEEWLAI